ncbi:MAG: S8 family serine peptidase [Elusimicrobia bacterium]|nr:S8 family serine peptidase [Elusimicrobiota bacterium]
MAGMRRILAAFLALLCCLEPACFALKTEKLFPAYPAVSGHARVAVEAASGMIFARFKAGTDAETKKKHLASAGLAVLKEFDSTGWTLVGLPDGMTVTRGLALAKNVTGLEAAEPDRAYRVKKTPNDPLLSSQYALVNVLATSAWEFDTGSSNTITVAILDTGIDGTHPDLSGKLTGQSQFFDPNQLSAQSPNAPTPACNHATHAAGVAAASTDNGIGIAGMSWGAKLLSLKVFSDNDCTPNCGDKSGTGSCSTDDATISAAINYAVTQNNSPGIGRIIINMSLGSPGTCDSSGQLQAAVNSAYAAGLLIVAAGGNESSYVDSPANCSHVIPVGATDSGDNLASFSNYGSEMTQGGLTAPGDNLLTTDLAGAYTYASGTSFSAPMVSGLAALIWSAKPGLSPGQVWDIMKNSADDLGMPGADQYFGFGRINALKAMRLAVNNTYADFKGAFKSLPLPNPFRPKTDKTIVFTIPTELLAGNVELRIYTQEGELVKKLSSPGWDGKNESGFFVASGVYVFHLKTDKGSAKGKFAVIR